MIQTGRLTGARLWSTWLRSASASTAATSRPLLIHKRREWRREEHREQKGGNSSGRTWRRVGATTAPLLGLSWLVTVKDLLGIDPLKLDKDPLKEKVKKSWLFRKYGRYDEALATLDEALQEATERGESLPITRVFDEIANTQYQKGDLVAAEATFRLVMKRLVDLHGKGDKDPEFIGVSLKLADLLAQRGEIRSAEAGFKHCVIKQMEVVDQHLKKYLVAAGAMAEERHRVDVFGAEYTDPLALFGMALEAYAHFLINYFDETRHAEAQEYMDETLKIAYQIYGSAAFHTLNILNNFGAVCILKNRFSLALKYLEMGVQQLLYVNECSAIIPGYYCNYAEALFHSGRKEEALEWARKAVNFSRSEDPKIQKYTANYLKDLEADLKKQKGGRTWWIW